LRIGIIGFAAPNEQPGRNAVAVLQPRKRADGVIDALVRDRPADM
jgi:hypothetical protein